MKIIDGFASCQNHINKLHDIPDIAGVHQQIYPFTVITNTSQSSNNEIKKTKPDKGCQHWYTIIEPSVNEFDNKPDLLEEIKNALCNGKGNPVCKKWNEFIPWLFPWMYLL